MELVFFLVLQSWVPAWKITCLVVGFQSNSAVFRRFSRPRHPWRKSFQLLQLSNLQYVQIFMQRVNYSSISQHSIVKYIMYQYRSISLWGNEWKSNSLPIMIGFGTGFLFGTPILSTCMENHLSCSWFSVQFCCV